MRTDVITAEKVITLANMRERNSKFTVVGKIEVAQNRDQTS